MSYYKIKSILHSGRKGERDTPRTDGRYPLRINRIVELDEEDIDLGFPLVINYIKDENGDDYRGLFLRTSYVKDMGYTNENLLFVETNNSIYEFEKIEGEIV